MEKLSEAILMVSLVLGAFTRPCSADTFINPTTDEVFFGYATSRTQDGKTIVQTEQKGPVKLNLAQWRISTNRLGRNNKIIVLTISNEIMLQIETQAFTEAITTASDSGPLFILLQLDTPGGRIDYTCRICNAITQTQNCPVIAFVNGKKYGGAMSAGAAVAFACDKIYMANNAVIGAAAPVALSKAGLTDFKEIYGEQVAEKITSVWRTYLASLAEQNQRPGLLAGAMVDENLEVIEVSQDDNTLFIEPVNKTPQQHILHTWSQKGSLLTLTSQQAVECGIADKAFNTRDELLRYLEAEDAEIVINDAVRKATEQFKRAKLRFDKLSKSLDLKIKQMKQATSEIRILKFLRDIREEYKSLISLARLYPDLNVDTKHLERQLNSAEALYKEAKTRRYLRR